MAIALDAQHGFLYTADSAPECDCARWASMGSNPVKLVTEGVAAPEAIALDPIGERVYWTNWSIPEGPNLQAADY